MPFVTCAQTAEDYFHKGMQLFQSNRLTDAKAAFEKARDLGMQNERLYFNIGVIHYKLGLYQSAYDAFQKSLTLPQMRFLARFNSGLCAQKLNNKPLAIENYQQAYALAMRKAQRILVRRKLVELGVQVKKSVYFSNRISLGYSDNVSFSNETLTNTSDTADYFVSLSGKLHWYLSSHVSTLLSYQIYNYDKLKEYDYQNYRPAILYSDASGALAYSLEIAYKQEYLDDSALMDWYIATVGSSYRISKTQIFFNYRKSRVEPVNESYLQLQGKIQNLELGVDSSYHGDSWGLKYNRESTHPDTIDYNAALYRKKWSLHYSYAMNPNNYLRLKYSYRESFFPFREDTQNKYELQYLYAINAELSLALTYHELKNRSTTDAYGYTTRILSLGLIF